jgi:hypothetical protein
VPLLRLRVGAKNQFPPVAGREMPVKHLQSRKLLQQRARRPARPARVCQSQATRFIPICCAIWR